ncbi:hypothetical protein UFOVP45_5 [uncultured Caudovirales phage]|uniref:Uncharacterized protein n=1 Tax=uncultured Caudovirales phage TaxID=2100421 RepID=A0A6J5KR15_9CAUD|nr:hypothetical protein UFOVP45_5 [uncultured Caudovirales phage]
MIPRKLLAPNGRSGKLLSAFSAAEAPNVKYPKSIERPSVIVYKQRGRTMDGGNGGGRIISK